MSLQCSKIPCCYYFFFIYHHFYTKNIVWFWNLNTQPILHWSTYISHIFSSEFQAQTSLTPNTNLLLGSQQTTFTKLQNSWHNISCSCILLNINTIIFHTKIYMLIRSFDQIKSGLDVEYDQHAPKSNSEWTHIQPIYTLAPAFW